MFSHWKLDVLVKRLLSSDPDKRNKAAEELERTRLSTAAGVKALRAATMVFPPGAYDWHSSAEDLIEAATRRPHPKYIPVILEVYGEYESKARPSALRLLSRLPQHEAAEAFVTLIRRHGWPEEIRGPVMESYRVEPRHVDVLFPDLLDYAPESSGEYETYHLCLKYCQDGVLKEDKLVPYESQFLSAYNVHKAALMPAQQDEGIAWMWEDDYLEHRDDAALLLDLLGHIDTPARRKVLREALTYRDPRLKRFAVVSLLLLEEEVEPYHIQEVAGSHEARGWLYAALDRMDLLELFPAEYATQEALAYADMVRWLIFPTELDREPDEIELMKVISQDSGTPDGIGDYYVFRFRTFPPHWAAEKGWMAGVSGPFIRDADLTPFGGGDTFSEFEAWDSRTAEEHLGDTQEWIDSIPQ